MLKMMDCVLKMMNFVHVPKREGVPRHIHLHQDLNAADASVPRIAK